MPQLAGTPTLSPLAAQSLTGIEQQLGIPAAYVGQFETAVRTLAGHSAGQFLQGKDRGRYNPTLPVQVPYDLGPTIGNAHLTLSLNITYGVGSVQRGWYVVNIESIS